jgi:hypothetical protein
MDCFASLATTAVNFRYAFAISPCIHASFAINIRSLISEGVGNAGRSMHPQPRV